MIGTESLGVTAIGSYNTKDVATATQITVSVATLTDNLAAGGLASNYTLATGQTAFSSITPAQLTYTANAASRTYGAANPALSGTVTGFVNGETQASATTASVAFTTAATVTSSVGSYAVNGAGLVANNGNYTLAQATGNAAALSVVLPREQTVSSSTLLAEIQAGQPIPVKVADASTLMGLGGAGGTAGGLFINASGLPQMLLLLPNAGTSPAVATGSLPVFMTSGPGAQVVALPLFVNLQTAPGGLLASLRSGVQNTVQNTLPNVVPSGLQRSQTGSVQTQQSPQLFIAPERITPLQVTLLNGTQLSINVGMSGQALVLQLPPELSRQDALRSGVLAALATSLAELGVSVADVTSVVLQQRPRQLAAR